MIHCCRQLRFSLYSGAVTTEALAVVVFLYYLLILALWSVLCLMPSLPSLLQCCWVLLSWSSACLVVLLKGALLVWGFGLLQCLFYWVHIHIALWQSLSGLVHSGIALSGFPGPWLGSYILGWHVIGNPMIDALPSMSIVRLIMIGYHCNHLDGQLNHQASAHWLIIGATN